MRWDKMGRDAREGMRALFAIERARAGGGRSRSGARAHAGDVRDRARGDPTRIARIADGAWMAGARPRVRLDWGRGEMRDISYGLMPRAIGL